MSVSVFNHPVLSSLLGHAEIAAVFEFEAELSAMLAFESALANAQSHIGLIEPETYEQIANACATFNPDITVLRNATATDGVIVPELIRQLGANLEGDAKSKLHFGATSQDVIDTSLILRLKKSVGFLEQDLDQVIGQLDSLAQKFGDNKIFARTRLQQAYEIPVSHRIAEWRQPLVSLRNAIEQVKENLFKVQLGGGAGDMAKLGKDGPAVRRHLAEILELRDPLNCWHTDRLALTDFGNWLTSLTTSLGKFGTDISLMAVNEIAEAKMAGSGGSSAMPHKQNPIKSELLMTLAQFNCTQIAALHSSALHEFERSGSSWSLEWMILPQMTVGAGAALKLANTCLGNIEKLG